MGAGAALVEEDSVANIEGDGPEFLDREAAQAGLQVVPCLGRIADAVPYPGRLADGAAASSMERP
jgi:hypothetical protein